MAPSTFHFTVQFALQILEHCQFRQYCVAVEYSFLSSFHLYFDSTPGYTLMLCGFFRQTVSQYVSPVLHKREGRQSLHH